MAIFQRKPKEIFALQIIEPNFDEIRKRFDCDIALYGANKAVEFDGEIYGIGWCRFFSFGDWIVREKNGSTPSIESPEDFEEEYEPIKGMAWCEGRERP
jgi:hypothetical protein